MSWNVQRVSSGLSTLVHHISELREWDAILLQELFFKDELTAMDELESSLGDHKLMTNPNCPWDTAIIIHNRWKGAVRWFASSQYALWVGLKDAEELTLCSVHLPSWGDDSAFELALVRALEAGRSKASGSIVMGIDANCNVDCSDDQRGALVKELCATRGLLPHFQRNWTLAWQSPTGVERKKKVGFIFSNQTEASAAIAEDMHSRSDHNPLCLTRSRVPGVMLEIVNKKRTMAGWFPQTLSQHPELQISVSQRTHLGSTVGQIQQVFESVMSEVEAERLSQRCEPLSDTEIRLDNARRDLQTLVSSLSSQALNCSSLGAMQTHVLLSFEEIQRQKRTVADLRAKVAAERRLLTLRRLSCKVNDKRKPRFLRDSTGQQVQDQSRWGHLVHEHFPPKKNRMR